MLIKRPSDIKSREITDKDLYLNRRQFIFRFISMTAVAAAGGFAADGLLATVVRAGQKLTAAQRGNFADQEKETSLYNATHYNNYKDQLCRGDA